MRSIPSKDIKDYFEAKLSDIKAEVELPFGIFLYFEMNSHLILWRARGDSPSTAFLEKYVSRGLDRIWIHSSDAEAFAAYTRPAVATDTSSAENDNSPFELPPDLLEAAASTPEPEVPRLPETEKLIEALKSEDPKAVSAQAQSLVAEAASAETPEQQVKANAKMREIVRDVMDELSNEAESLVSEVWKLAEIDPDLEHAVNVSTFAVIFALAFGRIDNSVIADLALAGLLHDIGITQVSARLTPKAWKTFSPSELSDYSQHVNSGVELITAYAPMVSERVKTLIGQHHEKFNGTGYPNRLQGFQVDDVAQLVSISDVLDSVASGKWDGTVRSFKSTLEFLEGLEKSTTFPEYFNPDVFGIVATWSKSTNANTPLKGALETVKSQTDALLKV
jgi:hypothetical protein